MSVTLHREEVKAAIRVRHGSIEAFAAANDIEAQAVRDLLRGKSSTGKDAVAVLLNIEADQLIITQHSTNVEPASTVARASHRKIAKAA